MQAPPNGNDPNPNPEADTEVDYESSVKKLPVANTIQKRRLTNEIKLMEKEHLHYCSFYPDKNNLLIWNFLIYGQKGTPYEGGEYIGQIVHSPKYPITPPNYFMFTPSGRYETNKKICLSNSSYHTADWSSTWTIVNLLVGFNMVWMDDKEHGVSHIHESLEERRIKARNSVHYNMTHHREIYEGFDRRFLRDTDPDPVPVRVPATQTSTQTVSETPNDDRKVSSVSTTTETEQTPNVLTENPNPPPSIFDNIANIGNMVFGGDTNDNARPEEKHIQIKKKRSKKIHEDS